MGARDFQRAFVHQREDAVDLLLRKRFQQRTNLRSAALKVLDKIFQVTDEMLLIHQKLRRFHLLFRAGAVKFPQVILMVLTKAAEILLQFPPPFPHLFQGHLFQLFRSPQSPLYPAESAGRKACAVGIQVFQRNGHAFHFQGGLCHHVLELAVFKICDGIRLVRVLDRGQVFPLD